MKRHRHLLLVASLTIGLAGCAGMTSTQQRTLSGTTVGAAGGAVIGAMAGNAGLGAGIGAATGLLGGYLYDQHKQSEEKAYQQGYQQGQQARGAPRRACYLPIKGQGGSSVTADHRTSGRSSKGLYRCSGTLGLESMVLHGGGRIGRGHVNTNRLGHSGAHAVNDEHCGGTLS